MNDKKPSRLRRFRAAFASFLVLIGLFAGGASALIGASDTYAIPENETETIEESEIDDGATNEEDTTEENSNNRNETSENTEEDDKTSNNQSKGKDGCKESLGALGWLVCPATGVMAKAVDTLYGLLEDFLVIKPVSAEDGSPIYEIWKYCLGITNIVFIIFFLVVIYSQITGYGISNYGVKKSLPKLVVAAIMVNLSFLICTVAVDVSNIVGNSLVGMFESVEETAGASSTANIDGVGLTNTYTALVGGSALAIGGAAIAFEFGMIWLLIPVVLGALVAIATGLVMIAMRQAVVVLLIMISPLAMVANMLPNTEKWFKKWKDLLTKMLVFYPMFALLFGASSLAGFAIMMSATTGVGIILGIAVQVFPLFFSFTLLKMSGTFLGGVSSKLHGLTSSPLAANRAWAAERAKQTRFGFLAVGRTPSSHLRRFMSNRRALREKYIDMLAKKRQNDANVYVQRKIGGGYDGTKAQGTSGYLKPNKYTKAAKELSTSNMLSEMAEMDTAHVLSNYGDYFVSKRVRDRVKAAEDAGDSVMAKRIAEKDRESRRGAAGGRAFLEYSRATMTKENDDEADFNYMVSQYLDTLKEHDPNDNSGEFSRYRHYIASSAGGLGDAGQTRVLGKIIAQAASVENSQRRDMGIIAAKYPHDKAKFRSMFAGFYVDDNGYATDREGNVLPDEKYRGYLLQHHPEKLVLWDQVDDQGRKYYDWHDSNGQFVTRIYDTDSSAFKELLSNHDAIINDPINNLYGILAGIKPGEVGGGDERFKHIGLDKFRTTIGRALMSAPFKEKNAAFSPMVAEMIKKGYIENYAQEYLAYLDSLNKATKPGAFNTQDADAINTFATIMDPDNWSAVFPEELIRGYRNVNGELISGYKLDENGNVMLGEDNKPIKVANGEATYDELMACVKKKFIIPAGKKMTAMMEAQTPNTMDNQKPGSVSAWGKLVEVFEKWGEDNPEVQASAYKHDGEMRQIVRSLKEKNADANGTRDKKRRSNTNNHLVNLSEMFDMSLDAYDYAEKVEAYCKDHGDKLGWVADQVHDYMVMEGYGATKEQVREKVEEILAYVDFD